jgi:type III pantothenate kinase
MLVAIDVGNTEVKLAIIRHGRVLAVRRAATRSRVAAYDVDGLLADALGLDAASVGGGSTVAAIEAVALVSVVPRWTEAVRDVARRMSRPLLMAGPGTIPIPVHVPHPERVGADRLLDAFAALRLHGAPVIVVDLGTATTVDAVDASGAFVGGAIAAGLELGLAALASGTARLPRVPAAMPERAIGRDTSEALQSGAVLGHIGLVRELTERIAAELTGDDGARPQVVVTGGLSAAPWSSALPGVDVIDPELTLKGLALLHAEVGAPVLR